MHRIGTLILVCSVAWTRTAGAAEPWPKHTNIKVNFVATAPEALPSGLGFDQITVEGRDPHEVGLCWIDLNRDGKPELLVDSHEGGTGGSYFHVFARTRAGFRRVAGWQGGVTVVAPANGYYQLESWSSGGGGGFSRLLLRYKRNRYRPVRLEYWRSTEEGCRFIRRRDPKEAANP